MFLKLKSLFFGIIFLKKSLSFCGAETPFPSSNFWVGYHFWTLSNFHVFEAEIIVFWLHAFGKIRKFQTGWNVFSVKNFPTLFRRGNRAHNSWLKAPRRFLMSFLHFKYFLCFWSWNHCFLIPFFLKQSPSFCGAETSFPSRNFRVVFRGGNRS